MVKSNFFADPTADTFHGVKITRGMRISYSASENTKMRAHIIRYQLTKASPDFHLAELHKVLGIADLGQKYIDIIYPKIANAVKGRIEELSNQKGCNEMLEGVKDGDQTRFYPPALDAWTLPTWQGDVAMPDAPDAPDVDEQGQDGDPKQQQQQDIAVNQRQDVDVTPPPPAPPPPPSPPPVFHPRVSLRDELLPPADLQPSSPRARPARLGLRRSRASEPIESDQPAQKDRQPVSLRPGDITPPTRDRVLSSQHRLGGLSQRLSALGFVPDNGIAKAIITRSPQRQIHPVGLPTPPATVVKPRRTRVTLPLDDFNNEQPLQSRRMTLPPDGHNEADLLPQYRFLLDKLAELHLELRRVQGDEITALWRGRNNNNGRAQTMRAELRLLKDQTDHLRQRAAPLRDGLDIITQELARGLPGAQGGSHVLGATVDLLFLGLDL